MTEGREILLPPVRRYWKGSARRDKPISYRAIAKGKLEFRIYGSGEAIRGRGEGRVGRRVRAPGGLCETGELIGLEILLIMELHLRAHAAHYCIRPAVRNYRPISRKLRRNNGQIEPLTKGQFSGVPILHAPLALPRVTLPAGP